MLDLELITNTPEVVKTALAKRNGSEAYLTKIDEILSLNIQRKKLLLQVEEKKATRNKVSKDIPNLKKQGQDVQPIMEEMRVLGEEIQKHDQEVVTVLNELNSRLLEIPNMPDESVPAGLDENENKLVKEWGQPTKFTFEPKDHSTLGEQLGLLDFAAAVAIAGPRFAVLKGQLARLERALISFFLDTATLQNGYTEMLPPVMVNSNSLIGTNQLPKFEADLFKIKDFDLYMAPTAEVPVTNYHREQILNEEQLPIKYAAYTPCFRSEAGSYGRDVKGLIRQHQFNKVELVQFSHPDHAAQAHEDLTRHAEGLLEALELPYRRMLLCTGDMGFGAAKCYDLEVWLPTQNKYREISSCSWFKDFQARRAQIKFRDKDSKKPRFLHTLNGSGLAVGRTLVAIMENYQQADGSILIPKVLQKYTGFERISK